MRLRLTAAGAALASLVVFALTIVLLVAGIDTSKANDDYWIALNTTGVGSNLVTVAPAPSSSSSTNPFGPIISSIPGLEPMLNNVTQQLGNGLSDAQGQIVGALVSSIGLKNYYLLYPAKMCEGDSNGNGGFKAVKCYPYSDSGQGLMNISNSIPSTFTIANAQVSVPAVNGLSNSLKNIVSLAVGVSTALVVFLSITCVASALAAVGSVLGIFWTQKRLLTILNLVFSAIAATTLSVLATTLTGVVLSTSNMVNSFGSALSIHLVTGASFLAIIWVATVLASIANSYWFLVWFVEFRRTAFSRRSRTKAQIGNWPGILAEFRRDIKIDGHFAPPDEDGEHGDQEPSTEKRATEQDPERHSFLTTP